MYLSRVEIDSYNRQKMKELSHIAAYHSWVEDCFPEERQEEERTRKLWRVDQLDGKNYLLVLSPGKPNLEILEKFGRPSTGETKDYEGFLASLKEGDRARFRVVLNPVVSKYRPGQKRGQVYPILNKKDQEKFLYDRAEKNGFKIEPGDAWIVDQGFYQLKKKGKRLVKLNKVAYEGRLEITNLEKFKETLTQGFGKKKAYGFGLMTIISYK